MANEVQASDDQILFEVRGAVAVLTFNRPRARNALTFAMYDGLEKLCAGMRDRGDVRALIITGAGGQAFAAGTDISQFRSFAGADDALAYERRIDEVLGAIEACPVPTIAALAGACTGGGAAIALACDMRLASRDLRFGIPIARTLGNCLSCASLSRLTQQIGVGRTTELLFTARLMGADEALALGLVTEVAADHAALMQRAWALAQSLALHAPLTLRATKEALRRLRVDGPAARDEDLITMCYTSQDFRAGLEAFLAKRPPTWTGR